MSEVSVLHVNDLNIELTRKRIKNLHLRVMPPNGAVRVSAPNRVSQREIKAFVLSRYSWIKAAQHDIESRPEVKPQFLQHGETVFFRGEEKKVSLIPFEGRESIKLLDDTFQLKMNPLKNSSISIEAVAARQKLIDGFNRRYLKSKGPELIAFWEPIIGVESKELGIKKMKTKWGTCNVIAKRIWLNLELATKPSECLEYVVIHELVHLHERYHNARFYAYMDRFLPDWRKRKALLNTASL